MVTTRLGQNWGMLALRGAIAILFGIIAIAVPTVTLAFLVTLFGAYALIDGIVALIASFRFAHEHERWLPLLIEGLLGIIVGAIVFLHPLSATLALIWVFGFWALVTGILEIIAAVRLRQHVAGELFLAITGVLSVILGILLLTHPITTASAYVWVIGIYAIIAGVMTISLALRVKKLHSGTDDVAHPRAV